jgi:transposase-like protein
VHKLRNILEHLPKDKQSQAIWRLKAAWSKASAEAALKELRQCIQWLETISPGAARSLEEGLEETLTINRLGLTQRFAKSFASTNLIESCFSNTRMWLGRVKHWRDTKMILRWSAAALLAAEANFNRVWGHEQMTNLIIALNDYQLKLVPQPKAA